MNYLYFFAILTGIFSGLLRYNVRFRRWKLYKIPVGWVITGFFVVIGLLFNRADNVGTGVILGAGIIGAVSGEIFSEASRQIGQGCRLLGRLVGRFIPIILLVIFVGFLAKTNPNLLGNVLAIIMVITLPWFLFKKAFFNKKKK